jgi:hypothetical protein
MMGARKDPITHGVYPAAEVVSSGEFDGRLQEMIRGRKSIFAETWPAQLGKPLQAWAEKPLAPCAGYVDNRDVMKGEARTMSLLTGWVWDQHRRAVPDMVAFTDEAGKVIGFAKTGFPRPDVAKAMKDKSAELSGWHGVAYADPGMVVHAYGLDPDGQTRVCEFTVHRPAAGGFVNEPTAPVG